MTTNDETATSARENQLKAAGDDAAKDRDPKDRISTIKRKLFDEPVSEGKLSKKPCFYFIGSGISSLGNTNLPNWDQYVQGTMTGLGHIAGLGRGDLEILARLDDHRKIIKKALHSVRNNTDRDARPSYLENYHITDLLSRRLGQDYMKILDVFSDAIANPLHQKLLDDILDRNGTAVGIVTTNFDTCLDSDLQKRERDKGKIILCRMKGVLSEDLDEINKAAEKRKNKEDLPLIVLLCQSFEAFDLVSSLMYHILDSNSHFRFIFNIHGTARMPNTCVDSSFQREQRLPYGVAQALTSLYENCRFIVAGYSGLDMNENLDYLRMMTNWEHINGIWLDRYPKPDSDAIQVILEGAISAKRRSSKSNTEQQRSLDPYLDYICVDLWLEKTTGGVSQNFETKLDLALANACSREPMWAILALKDIQRALKEHLHRSVLSEERLARHEVELAWEKEISQLLMDKAALKRRTQISTTTADNAGQLNQIDEQLKAKQETTKKWKEMEKSLTKVQNDLDELERSLSLRLDILLRKAPMWPTTEKIELRNYLIESWLVANSHDPIKRWKNPNSSSNLREALQYLIPSFIKMLRRIKLGRQPKEKQLENLKHFAEYCEIASPQLLPDAWVVYATYIMLNVHDKARRNLCWSYYLKAMRHTLITGNVWGKVALDDLKDGPWSHLSLDKDFKHVDHRSALRFHKEVFRSDEVGSRLYNSLEEVKCFTYGYKLQKPQGNRLDKILSHIHVNGVDEDLPVHQHNMLPLAEQYRVMLIIALTFGKLALIRENAVQNNRVFLEKTLIEAGGALTLFPNPDRTMPREFEEQARDILEKMSDKGRNKDGEGITSQINKSASAGNLVQEDNATLNRVLSCIRGVKEDPEAGLHQLEYNAKVTVGHDGDDKIDLGSRDIDLLTASENILRSESEDTVVNTLIQFHVRSRARKDNSSADDRSEIERNVREVIQVLRTLASNYRRLTEKKPKDVEVLPPWSRDLLYHIFTLGCKTDIDLTDKREALLEAEDLASQTAMSNETEPKPNQTISNWIENTYKIFPWKYQDTLQLLISAPFAVNRAVRKREAVLALNLYEKCQFFLGVLAFTTYEERENMFIVVNTIDGAWRDYERFSLSDITKLRAISRPKGLTQAGSSHLEDKDKDKVVGVIKMTEHLANLQVGEAYGFGSEQQPQEADIRKLIEDRDLHAKPADILAFSSPTEAEHWLEKRRKTVIRLMDEFILRSKEALEPMYIEPEFTACIYRLAKVGEQVEGTCLGQGKRTKDEG